MKWTKQTPDSNIYLYVIEKQPRSLNSTKSNAIIDIRQGYILTIICKQYMKTSWM